MEKQEKIVSMFNNIAPTYDKANRVLSMGIDKSWRDKACNKTFELYGKKEIEKIVDVACGTGDMIIFWKQNAGKYYWNRSKCWYDGSWEEKTSRS